MKKILTILICVLLGVSATYAATARAKASLQSVPVNGGWVFVSKDKVNDINNITGWQTDHSDEETASSGFSAGTATVYSYAKAATGYTFIGWSDTETGTPNNTTQQRETKASTPLSWTGYQNKTVEDKWFAQFKPIITCQITEISLIKTAEETTYPVSVQLYNAKDFEIVITETKGDGVGLLTYNPISVSGNGYENIEIGRAHV